MKPFDWVNDVNPQAYAIIHYGIWLRCNNYSAVDGNQLYHAISFIAVDDSRTIREGIMQPLSFSSIFEETLRNAIEN